MIIRETIADDALPLKQMLYRVWHQTYTPFLGAERVDHLTQMWHTPEGLAEEVDLPRCATFVALAGDTVIGHVLVTNDGEGDVHVRRLYLDQAYHGQGIGDKLLEKGLAAFANAKTARLEVYENNARAVSFYKRHGFSVSEKLRDQFTDDELYEFRMTKPL